MFDIPKPPVGADDKVTQSGKRKRSAESTEAAPKQCIKLKLPPQPEWLIHSDLKGKGALLLVHENLQVYLSSRKA
jgi:hypothetical protein